MKKTENGTFAIVINPLGNSVYLTNGLVQTSHPLFLSFFDNQIFESIKTNLLAHNL